jgi:hypothetical protein
MKSALELAMEKMQRLNEKMTSEEKEASRHQHYMNQGETLANSHINERSFSLEKVEADIQRIAEEHRELVWQGFWKTILATLQIDTPSGRVESAVARQGGEKGRELIEDLHQLRALLQKQGADDFAACVAYFEGHARLKKLAATGLRIDYLTVARQSRRLHEQQSASLASQAAALEKAKTSFRSTLFYSTYPNIGKNRC